MNLLPTFKYCEGFIYSVDTHSHTCIIYYIHVVIVPQTFLACRLARIIFHPRQHNIDGVANDLITTTVIYEKTISPSRIFPKAMIDF